MFQLSEDIFYEVPVDVGEAALDAVVVEGEAFVVNAQQVEGGGVEVVGVSGVLGGFPAEFVGGPVADASLGSSARQPSGEGPCVVVAPESPATLGGGLAPELGGADDKGFVEQAVGLEVLQQGGGSAVKDASPVAMVAGQVLVAVPVGANLAGGGIFGSTKNLHETHAAFGQAAGQQTLATKVTMELDTPQLSLAKSLDASNMYS